eukprot:8605422-Ditylum_brightwellii.AAC.1
MFLDDMTAHHNGGQVNCNEQQLMDMIHHDRNMWDKILNVTGSLLESVKSGYSLMIWEFDRKGKPSLKKEKDMDPNTVFLTQEG